MLVKENSLFITFIWHMYAVTFLISSDISFNFEMKRKKYIYFKKKKKKK